MTKRSLVFALGLAAALTASQARAGAITTLFSTGEGLGLGVHDPNYTLVPPLVGLPYAADAPFTYLNPNWVPPPAGTQWITPVVPQTVNGAYNYETTFTLGPGMDPKTAQISGVVGADDTLVGVVLNGVTLPITTPANGFVSLTSFDIPVGSNFVSGVNTLEFLTMNTHEVVTGLLVSMTGTAVPEPTSISLLGIGLSGLFAFRRFFKRARIA